MSDGVDLTKLSTDELLRLADQVGLHVHKPPVSGPQPPGPEHFIVPDGDDVILLTDGEFDGTMVQRGKGTYINDHRKGERRIFHSNGQRATFTHPKTGEQVTGLGVDHYQFAAETAEWPKR